MSNIILASASEARQKILTNAGISFDVIPANLDEETVQKQGGEGQDVSMILAQEKAIHVSKKYPDKYIIGSDQILSMNNIIYAKAKNKEEAYERLKIFSGKKHFLISSVVVAKNKNVIFKAQDSAHLTMKNIGSEKIKNYINEAGDIVTKCVGCYAIEGIGIRLFEEIKGDYFTILGMPFLPLLNFLDGEALI